MSKALWKLFVTPAAGVAGFLLLFGVTWLAALTTIVVATAALGLIAVTSYAFFGSYFTTTILPWTAILSYLGFVLFAAVRYTASENRARQAARDEGRPYWPPDHYGS